MRGVGSKVGVPLIRGQLLLSGQCAVTIFTKFIYVLNEEH